MLLLLMMIKLTKAGSSGTANSVEHTLVGLHCTAFKLRPNSSLKCVYLNGDWQIYMTHTHSPIFALCGYPHYHCPHFEAVSLFQTKYFSEYLCWASLSICICGTSWLSVKAHDLRHLHGRVCFWYDPSWFPEYEHKVIYLCVEFQLSQTQVFCQ